MNILFLAHFYPPEMGGAGARLHGLARMLVRAGHTVTVITGFPNYPHGQVYEGYRGKRYAYEVIDGVHVVRTWIYTSSKGGGLRRLANYFSFVLSSLWAGVRVNRNPEFPKFDVVLASSPPLFIGLSGLGLAKYCRIPFVFDIRDIWPELAVEAGEFAPDDRIVRWGETLERFLYRHADHIVVVTERKAQKLLDKGVPLAKLSVVANGVDLDLINPASTDLTQNGGTSRDADTAQDPSFDWRKELGLNGKFVALYAGLIGIFQGIDVIAKAAKELQANDAIHFVIVGEGVKKADIEAYVAEYQLNNVTILPAQPKEQIPPMLRSFDLALVPLVNEQLVDAVPSKLLEAMGCQCPVLLIAGGESRRIMEEAKAGVVVEPGAPSDLAQTVETFASLPEAEKDTFAQNGYCYVLRHHDRAVLAHQLEQVLLTITSPSS